MSAQMFGHEFDKHFHSSDSQRMDKRSINSSLDDAEDDSRSVGTSMSSKSLRAQKKREKERKKIDSGEMSPIEQIAKFFKNEAWPRMKSLYICRLPDDDPRFAEFPSWEKERDKMKPVKCSGCRQMRAASEYDPRSLKNLIQYDRLHEAI